MYSGARCRAVRRSVIFDAVMQVEFADFIAGARAARGVAIIIDVFRACTVIARVIAAGANRVIPVAGVDEALALKRSHPDWLLIGERNARPLPGFDAGNSPTELQRLELNGRTIVHTTHAGTQGLVAAGNASHVFTGALVNASSTVRAVLMLAPSLVTLVRMGTNATARCEEDDLCAELLAARLQGNPHDSSSIRQRLRLAPAAAKFFDPAATWAPQGDFELCTAVDSINIAVCLRRTASGAGALESCDAVEI